MTNEIAKTAPVTVSAVAPATVKTVDAVANSVSRDAVQDAGKARFGAGMMRF